MDSERQRQLNEWLSKYHDPPRVAREIQSIASTNSPRTDYYAGQLLITVSASFPASKTSIDLFLPPTFPLHPPIAVVKPQIPGMTDSNGRVLRGPTWNPHSSRLKDYLQGLQAILQSQPVSLSAGCGSAAKPTHSSNKELVDRLKRKLANWRREEEERVFKENKVLNEQLRQVTGNEEKLKEYWGRLLAEQEALDMATATLQSSMSLGESAAPSAQVQAYEACGKLSETIYTKYIEDLALTDTLYEMGRVFGERKKRHEGELLVDYLKAYRDCSRRLFLTRAHWKKLLGSK